MVSHLSSGCMCVCACARARMYVCTCVCVSVGGGGGGGGVCVLLLFLSVLFPNTKEMEKNATGQNVQIFEEVLFFKLRTT